MKKILTAVMICLLCILPLAGCGESTSGSGGGITIDPNKTQIYVHISGGGYGSDWLMAAKAAWEAEPGNEKYEIIPVDERSAIQGHGRHEAQKTAEYDLLLLHARLSRGSVSRILHICEFQFHIAVFPAVQCGRNFHFLRL